MARYWFSPECMKSQLFLHYLEEGAWGEKAPPPVPSFAASRLARLASWLSVKVVSDLCNKSQKKIKVKKFTLAMFAGVQTVTTPSLEAFLFFRRSWRVFLFDSLANQRRRHLSDGGGGLTIPHVGIGHQCSYSWWIWASVAPCSLRWVQKDLWSSLNSLTIVGIHRLSENWGLNPICYYCPEKWCTAFIIEENVYWHAR